MLLWVSGHFFRRRNGFYDMHFIPASAASVNAVLLCEIADLGQQLADCVGGITEGKATEKVASSLAGLGQLTSCRITKHPIGTSILSHVLPVQTHSYCNSMSLDV